MRLQIIYRQTTLKKEIWKTETVIGEKAGIKGDFLFQIKKDILQNGQMQLKLFSKKGTNL